MTTRSLALILISVFISALAQVLFKYGLKGAALASPGASPNLLTMLTAPGVIAGLGLYGIGTILWLSALSRVELSQAYPFVGIGFVLTTLAGWWLFDDRLSLERIAGIALIAVGIVFVARS